MRKCLFPILMVLLLMGCDKDYMYQFNSFHPKMTVNAEISPQEGLVVQVSHAVTPNIQFANTEQFWIKDASVRIFESGQLLGNLVYVGRSLYRPNFHLDVKIDASYYIEVSHHQYGIIKSSEVTIPAMPLVDSTIITLLERKSINNRPLYGIKFFLQDRKNAEDYYLIRATIHSPKTTHYGFLDLVTKNDELKKTCEVINDYALFFIRDNCFEGQRILLDFEAELREIQIPGGDISDKIPAELIEMRIYNITEDYFLYQRTGNIPEDFSLAFSDPEPLHSNMVGGYGIFKAFNYAKYVFAVR